MKDTHGAEKEREQETEREREKEREKACVFVCEREKL